MSAETNSAGVNSPELDARLREHVPGITDIGQAVALVGALQRENTERSQKNARIMAAYNAERPFDPEKLRADGLLWKANFSTKPLALLVDKVVPRYLMAVRNMRYLTASALPDTFPDASGKTEFFRDAVTRAVRSHPEWEDFLSSVVMEMVLFGYAAVGWPWKTEWFPTFFRQDDFLVPVGTRHTASSAQVICLRETFLRHELFEQVRDAEAAKAAGWNVENVVESINRATPAEQRGGDEGEVARQHADLLRESSVASSFVGAETIRVWHVFVAEVDGKVTHVAFDEATKKELLWRHKVFDSMSDVAAFFSFQHGNGRLHGSKGIGRELYNVAKVLERARCEVVDRLNLSGKLIVQCDERDIRKFRMSVMGNTVLIASPYQIAENRIEGDARSFFELDRFLTELLDQIAGAATPRMFSRERVSRAEVELFAAREEERRDALMERFLTQFARMMTTIQRRLLSPLVTDPVARTLREKLKARLSEEELQLLASQPAVSTVRDYTEVERAGVVALAREVRGNPLYNQAELERRRVAAQFGDEFANAVLLPQPDPTQAAEQSRQQLSELLLLQNGLPVPVSPRDAHEIHLGVLQDVARMLVERAMQSEAQGVPAQEVTGQLAAVVQHAAAHIQAAEAAGQKVVEFRQFFQSLEAAVRRLAEPQVQGVAPQEAPPQELPAGEPIEPSAGASGGAAPELVG